MYLTKEINGLSLNNITSYNTSPTIQSYGTTSASISWYSVPNAVSYEVFLSNDNVTYSLYASTSANTLSLSGLDQNSRYYLNIIAKVNGGFGYTSFQTSASIGPTLLIYDGLSGSYGTLLNSRTTDVGNLTWTANNAYILSGNNKITLSTEIDGAFAYLTLPYTSYKIETELVSTYSDDYNKYYSALLINYINANNFMHIEPSTENDQIYIYRCIGGVYTLIYTIPRTISNGEIIPIKVDIENTEITLEIGGLSKFTFVNSWLTPTHKVGFRCSRAGAPTIYGSAGKFYVYERINRIRWPYFTKDVVAQPVVALGTTGQWDDIDINNPNIVWDVDRNEWILNYSGYGGRIEDVQDYGYATSNSLNGPWVKVSANPVLSADVLDGKWAFNGGLARWKNKYWSVQGSGGGTSLRLRISNDMYTWTDHGIVWAPSAGTYYNNAVFDAFLRVTQDDRLELWCAAADAGGIRRIVRAYVNEDYTITKPASYYLEPPSFLFGNQFIGEPSVYVPPGKEGQEYLINFDSGTFNSASRSIAQAVTIDGGATWTWRLDASKADPARPFESVQNFDSFVIVDNGVMHLFYGAAAYNGATLGIGIQIGHSSCNWTYSSLSY